MTTRQDMRTALRDRLGESTAAAWTDTELNRWINEGVREVAILTEWNRVIDEQNVTSPAYRIDLTSTTNVIHRVQKCEWIDVSSAASAEAGGATHQVYRLEYQNISNLDAIRGSGQMLSDGIPAYYGLWGAPGSMKVILYPRPSTNGTLRVHGYAMPADLDPADDGADDDLVDVSLPVGWDQLVLDYAEYRALLRDKDDNWQIAKSQFNDRIREYKRMFDSLTDETETIQPWGSGATGWAYDAGWY